MIHDKCKNIKLPCNILLVGSTKSGKSTHCIKVLFPVLKPQADVLVICSPTMINGDYDFLEADDKKIFKVAENISFAVEELISSQRKLFEMREMGVIKDKEIPRILLVLDDCLDERILRGESSTMAKFATKSRHYYISTIIMSQRVNALPRQLRLNSAYFICFSVMGYSELERVMLEYVPKKFHKNFQDKMIKLFEVPFSYLFVDNFERNISNRVYENADKLIVWNAEAQEE